MMAPRIEKNDLKTWCIRNERQSLLDEWDYDKNGDLMPDTVTYGSQMKVWWICPKGHSFDAKIANRTLLNRNCPYCSGSKTLAGYNDFKTWCLLHNREDLLSEWDYNKNEISPSNISPQNSKKVWWRCSLGHEWDSTIGSRTSGRTSGCPFCSNPPKRILVGFNDFESWCIRNQKTDLLQEWDYEKNTEFMPTDISYGSGKKVWWKCSRGHEWHVSPSNRVQGTGCPVCSRTQTSFPEQAIAFYLSKSFTIIQRKRIKGFELDVFLTDYNVGIEYDGMHFHTLSNSKREQDKNAFFSSQGVLLIRVKENKDKCCIEENIVYYIPKRMDYLDGSLDNAVLSLLGLIESLTGVKVSKNVNIVRDELAIREQYASNVKEGSVASLYPELISEWDIEKNKGMTSDNFSANSHTKVWWRCSQGHSWQADISSRNRKLGCPFCAGQRTIVGINDLESWCRMNNPDLLTEWDYDSNTEKPSEIQHQSNKKVWWICAKGHKWNAVVANRVHGTRCPYCFTGNNSDRQKLTLEEWCIANGQEHLLEEWNHDKNGLITPKTVSKGSHKIVWWKCSNGHEWEAQIKSRTYNHGCPFCSKTFKRVEAGGNDLVTWCKNNGKQYILDEWDFASNEGLMPEMFTFGSHKRINWICRNGHKWSAVIKERTKYKGNMCPECKV